MKKYKLVKLGVFNQKSTKDIFIGNTTEYNSGIVRAPEIAKGLEDNEFMSLEEVEDYINNMESEWNFKGFQQFIKSKAHPNEPELIIYYALFWKESND